MRPIDADWLLDVVENIIDWDTERDKNRIIHQVRELTPTVDTEPKRGRWIEDKSTGYLVCDQCRDVYINPEWPADGHWKFCPNCGADMRGKQDG